MWTDEQIRLAYEAFPLLVYALLVAFCAYAAGSRLVFLCGLVGVVLVPILVPEPHVYINGSAEAVHLGMLQESQSHFAKWGFVGGLTGVLLSLNVAGRSKRAQRQ